MAYVMVLKQVFFWPYVGSDLAQLLAMFAPLASFWFGMLQF